MALSMVHCGLAPLLCNAAWQVADTASALEAWRQEAKHHLAQDLLHKIGRRNPALSASMPEQFPSINTVRCYIQPCRNLGTCTSAIPDSQPPNLAALGQLMQELVGWNDSQRLLDQFRRHVWTAVIVHGVLCDLKVTPVGPSTSSGTEAPRELLPTCIIRDVEGVIMPIPTLSLALDTLAAHKSSGTGKGREVNQPDLEVFIPSSIHTAWLGLDGQCHVP
ncbi:hypothetical protein PAXINDRAFT_14683 [Paxillus involutus ATCC 200175]|uniref:Uncharacterized protein n=1 Tax=Paxillus involutus ATCC 200175 TaxID=664439 RepID=A0A0C9TPJ8_PAXIN|nr:hypothetical protein PAXINDRAFT_14683 [Paxillus involutus ATCC 200175]